MSFQHSAAAILIVITLAVAPVAAEEWQARFAANWTDTALSIREVDEDGVALSFVGGDALGLSLAFERRVSDLVGLEFAIDFARPEHRIGVTPPGGDEISATAAMDLWTARAGLNFHLSPGRPVDVYVGPTVAWLYPPNSFEFRANVGGYSSAVPTSTSAAAGPLASRTPT